MEKPTRLIGTLIQICFAKAKEIAVSRLDEIRDWNNTHPPDDIGFVNHPKGDIEYLLKIAECAEEFAESFENYSKELGESCITGPEHHCRELRKAFEGVDE